MLEKLALEMLVADSTRGGYNIHLLERTEWFPGRNGSHENWL